MSGGLVRFLAGLPVVGYLLKVAHDLVMLPKLRADLHRESVDLALRLARQEARVNDQSSRLHVLSDRLASLAESVARLRQSEVQETGKASQPGLTSRARWERQDAIGERLAPLEASVANTREQLETVLQRVSDNLARWVELRQSLQTMQADSAARIDVLQAKTDEKSTPDQTLVVRLDDAAAKVQELQSQMNTLEDAFAGVLRRHTRTLAELREAIVSRNGDTHWHGGDMTPLLDSLRDLLGGRRVTDPPAIEEVPELPRRLQPPVRLLLDETVSGGRFSFRVASASGHEADLLADFSELPFAPAAVAEIRAGDVLDRCTPKEGRRLLSHWSQLLWTGGVLHLTFTDLEAAERTYAHVSSAFGELSRAILSQRGERRKAFNRDTARRLLGEAGFRDIIEQPNKDLSQGFRIEIQATKSGGMSA